MSPESNKSIEELLQASAQARRAQFGGDAKMPNPLRAQLHEEISRAARAEEAPERRSWFAAYWPRVVIGAAVAALVIGFPLIWWQRAEDAGVASSYAINEPLSPAVEPPPPVAMAPAPRDGMDSFAEAARQESVAKELKDERPSLAAAARPAPPAAAAPLPMEPSGTNEIAGAGMVADAESPSRAVRQQFAQTPAGVASRGGLRKAKAAEVLNTFQVEQEGNTIRVIDADGSTYTGTVQRVASRRAPQEKALATAPTQQQRARAASVKRQAQSEEVNEFSFRATGYNASLQKPVVFEGNYIAPVAGGGAQLSQRGGARAENEERAARVIGTARIPGETPVPVDAAAGAAQTSR